MKILIDTNVILDIVQKREPFFANVQGVDIHTAIMRSMPDFEDAVVDAVAERNGANYILTRNIKDFSGSSVPAMTPTEFLKK